MRDLTKNFNVFLLYMVIQQSCCFSIDIVKRQMICLISRWEIMQPKFLIAY